MVTIGDPPLAQVCSPQYDTECKTVQDEKCEIRSVPKIILFIVRGWRFVFRRGRLKYVIWGRGRGLPTSCYFMVPQIVSTSYMLMDQVRGQVRDEIRDQVRNTVRLGLQWCAGEEQDHTQHIDISCFVVVIVINAIQDPTLFFSVLSSSYSLS